MSKNMINEKKSIVTIGIFDGMHKGHQKIITDLVAQAENQGLQSVVFTFDPHPAKVHDKDSKLQLINSVAERVAQLLEKGVNKVHLIEYNLDFAQQSPEEFVKKYFIDFANAQKVIVGEDMKFGKNNSGNVQTLKEIAQKYNFEVQVLSDIKDKNTSRYASTLIRKCIGDGEVEKASEQLGENFTLYSKVVHGFKNGRKIGYPTANLDTENLNIIPKDGVYAGYLQVFENSDKNLENIGYEISKTNIDGSANITTYQSVNCAKYESTTYPVAISVGTNYQFEATERTVEAHVLGRADLNLYGKQVALSFVRYIRPMLKFDTLDDLLIQMRKDVCEVATILNVEKPEPIDPKEVTAL